MTSNHKSTTRGMSSNSNQSSLMAYYCKEIISTQVRTALKSFHLNRHPVPFKCIITPRTPTAEALIRDSVSKDGRWPIVGNCRGASGCELGMRLRVLESVAQLFFMPSDHNRSGKPLWANLAPCLRMQLTATLLVFEGLCFNHWQRGNFMKNSTWRWKRNQWGCQGWQRACASIL